VRIGRLDATVGYQLSAMQADTTGQTRTMREASKR